jgi:uncharacterized protein
MKKLFVDTAGWLALVNRSDACHAQATLIYNERFAAGWHFVTHAGVMLEVGNSLARVRSRHLAVQLKARLERSSRVEVVSLSDALIEAAWHLYEARPDKEWGTVDCLSFILMEQMSLTEALTTDHHFEQAGFTKLL